MIKKKINIFLVPAVILIWALIIYKVVINVKTPDTDLTFSSFKPIKMDTKEQKDTITINPNYRDPFKQVELFSATRVAKTAEIKPVNISINERVSWPVIKYGGMVKKTGEAKQLAILTMGEKTIVAGMNDDISGLIIVDIYPDSIRLLKQKEKKTFIKEPR